MPTNRRPSTSGQPSVRRPKVAGLRKREKTESPRNKTNKPEETTEAPVATEESAADTAKAEAAAETSKVETPKADTTDTAATETEAASKDAESTEEASEAAQTSSEDTAVDATESAASSDETSSTAEAKSEEPAAESESTSSEGTAKTTGIWAVGAGVWWGATAVLLVVFVVCAVMAYLTYFQGPMSNKAMVSAGETSEVKGQIEDDVQKIFSYDFNNTKKTEDAAKNVLVGPAVAKYNDLFAVVKQQAPQQQLIVTTTVKSSAVTQLQGNEAQVLLFVDQHALRSSTGESNVGPAQLSVTAEKQGDQWKITGITVR